METKKYFRLSEEAHEYYNLPYIELIDGFEEIWTFVVLDKTPEYNMRNKYIVSTYGRLLDLTTKKQPTQFNSYKTNAIGEHWKHVCLYFDTTHIHGIKYSVHRLICLAFLENDDPEHKVWVNHKDGHPQHNFLFNLEWCTAKENAEHAVRTGLCVNQKYGEDVPNAVFTNDEVHIACQLLEEGKKYTHIYLALSEICDDEDREITLSQVKSLCKSLRSGEIWKDISSQYDIKFKKKSKKSIV